MEPAAEGPSADDCLAIIGNPYMSDIIHHAAEDAIKREQFMDFKIPGNMSVRETEKLTTEICRLFSSSYPMIGSDEIEYWVYPTRTVIRLVTDIAAMSDTHSPINTLMETARGKVFINDSICDAAYTTCQKMGFSIKKERRSGLALSEGEPDGDGERLLWNLAALYDDILEYAAEPLTVSLLDEIYLRASDRMSNQTPLDELPRQLDGAPRSVRLQQILDVYGSSWSGISPLVDIIPIRWSLQFSEAYAAFSSLISDFYYRQICVRIGYPVLRFLPFAISWIPDRQGLIPRASDTGNQIELPYGNMTPLITDSLRETYAELLHKDAECTEVNRHDDELITILQSHRELNHRQRSIVGRALKSPNSTFCISHHRKVHGIAYSTARADLFGLADIGFLEAELEGKKYVFRPVPNLEEVVQGAISEI